MMTKLMTWFIELQNRFNELKLFKILMIYVLNWVDDLISWQTSMLKKKKSKDHSWKEVILKLIQHF